MCVCLFLFFVFVSHGSAARMVVARCIISVCICITWRNRGMAQGWLLLGAVPGLRNAASQPWSRPWHFGSCSLRTPCDARVVRIQVFVVVFVFVLRYLQPPYTFHFCTLVILPGSGICGWGPTWVNQYFYMNWVWTEFKFLLRINNVLQIYQVCNW